MSDTTSEHTLAQYLLKTLPKQSVPFTTLQSLIDPSCERGEFLPLALRTQRYLVTEHRILFHVTGDGMRLVCPDEAISFCKEFVSQAIRKRDLYDFARAMLSCLDYSTLAEEEKTWFDSVTFKLGLLSLLDKTRQNVKQNLDAAIEAVRDSNLG